MRYGPARREELTNPNEVSAYNAKREWAPRSAPLPLTEDSGAVTPGGVRWNKDSPMGTPILRLSI